MIVVYKYKVEMIEAFTIEAPQGTQFLDVQVQHGVAHVWARVDTTKPQATYKFGVAGTGHELLGDLPYMPHVGSFQLGCGSLVFHLFGGIYAV
jgi:meiotically up-regulated gene 157 (Mug157) protein